MSAVVRTDPFSAAARAAAARLRGWLLKGPAQLTDGRHCGGIAGRIEAGRAVYVYAEITGYYLHWLAGLPGIEPHDAIASRARSAVDWATRQFARGRVPPTRAYLDDGTNDWRNGAVFFFDLAMLLRGLGAARQAELAEPPASLLESVVAELGSFVDKGTLRTARPLPGTTALPQRWSTLGGPFLLKASSRVAQSGADFVLPAALLHACAAEAARWSPIAADVPLDMLHPTLYFAEGLLLANPARASAVAALLARCLALQNADGTLPEAEAGTALRRSDIIAQALRVGVLLRQMRATGAPGDTQLDRLVSALLDRVAADGAIAFDPAAQPPQPNVWCAMFAEQALRWYADWRDGYATAHIEVLV